MKKYRKPGIFRIFSNRSVNYGLLLVAGVFIGWIIFHPSKANEEKHDHKTELEQGTIWTCAMHPQIRMQEPGKCPICGMELIQLVKSEGSSIDTEAVTLSKEAAQLANVLTSVVTRQNPVKEVRLFGKVQADERLLQSLVAHVPGRIEKLFVNFTGERVNKGQVLVQIYSPDLITAQQELIEASKTKLPEPEIYEAAREKLRQWKLSDNQIEGIESSSTPQPTVDIVSNTSGIVLSRLVNTGDYVSQGTALFKIADLSKVWIMFDAYESDLQFLNKGEKVSFTLQALPGIDYSGSIVFIDPFIDPVTRVAKVRVETENKSGKLKPEMFATGIVTAMLNEYRTNLVIPKTAVLWTGKRSVVYIKQQGSDEPVFKIREVGLGPMLGESYIITDGLQEGEEIVTMGTFSVDAAAQLEGKPSMMNPRVAEISSMPDMTMPENKIEEMPGKIETGMEFRMQLTNLYDKYVVLKNNFISSDEMKVTEAAKKVQAAFSEVDMSLLSGEAHINWMKISGNLNNQLQKIISAGKLEEQRNAFSTFNDNLYITVKTFGLIGKTVYYQFCPMAMDGKGAYWLSEIKDIQNPYYGESMLTCGETKEILNF
jgi:Cu(I)/Ag(I) efflux system membrane fusion protein